MSQKYSNLLSPLKVRNFVLKNRLEISNSLPHFLQGPESYPADSVITHYANKAKAGAAIVTCMGINNFSRGTRVPMDVDFTHFPDYDLYEPTSQNYLMQLADAIHYHGAIACMGFFVGPPSGYPVQNPDGSLEILRKSPKPVFGEGIDQSDAFMAAFAGVVDSVTESDMEHIATSYAEQCKILKFLGYDMVSIHLCYRGQIPTQFLSPLTNKRTDKYGGCLENRARFPLMILQRIREAVGNDFLVEILFSGEDPEGGYTMDEGIQFLKMCEPYVDIVQFRAPEADPNHPTGFNLEETPFLKYAENAKKNGLNMIIACVGGFHYFESCERAVAEGKLDIVSAARSWISNPDYGKLLQEGRDEDLVPCLRCNKCHGRGANDPFVSVCSVNPIIGIEHMLHKLVSDPGPSKRIAIVGGGPAGMKAAMILCDRGHKVTLFEAGSSLGGALRHAAFVDFKWPLRDFNNYLICQVQKRDIDIRLNTCATPDSIKAEGFDVVITALGGVPIIPPIPGIKGKNVVTGVESMMNPDALGKNVVVIGGGEVGVETAMNLAKKGHEATVIEMRGELAPDTTLIHYRSMFQEAWEALDTFHPILNATCTSITEEGVTYKDQGGAEHFVPANSVVVSAGMKPLTDAALAFYGSADAFHMIGDCKKVSTVQQAMRTAFAVANSI